MFIAVDGHTSETKLSAGWSWEARESEMQAKDKVGGISLSKANQN